MIDLRLDMVDLSWSSSGDFIIENGDLADTFSTEGLGFIQEAEERVKSSAGDWKLLPEKGANIDEYHGEINNLDTWKSIESSITLALTADSFLNKQDFAITIAPITQTEIAIRIDFNASLTAIVPDSTIVIKVVYDLVGKGPFIIR